MPPPTLLPQQKPEIHLSPVNIKINFKTKTASLWFCFCSLMLLTCITHQSRSFSETTNPSSLLLLVGSASATFYSLHILLWIQPSGTASEKPYAFLSIFVFVGWSPRSQSLPSFQPLNVVGLVDWVLNRERKELSQCGLAELLENSTCTALLWWNHIYPGPRSPTNPTVFSLLYITHSFSAVLWQTSWPKDKTV